MSMKIDIFSNDLCKFITKQASENGCSKEKIIPTLATRYTLKTAKGTVTIVPIKNDKLFIPDIEKIQKEFIESIKTLNAQISKDQSKFGVYNPKASELLRLMGLSHYKRALLKDKTELQTAYIIQQGVRGGILPEEIQTKIISFLPGSEIKHIILQNPKICLFTLEEQGDPAEVASCLLESISTAQDKQTQELKIKALIKSANITRWHFKNSNLTFDQCTFLLSANSNLTELTIQNCKQITLFPKQNATIKKLTLMSSPAHNISNISWWRSLEELRILRCMATKLINNLTIKRLDLEASTVKSLTPLQTYKNLEELNISLCPVKILPRDILKVKTLDMRGTKVDDLSPLLSWNLLSTIYVYDSDKFMTVPQEIKDKIRVVEKQPKKLVPIFIPRKKSITIPNLTRLFKSSQLDSPQGPLFGE